ncbi:MAG: hypothetical protein ACHQ0Y_04775 [Thermodesulfovibrionales bacterium]
MKKTLFIISACLLLFALSGCGLAQMGGGMMGGQQGQIMAPSQGERYCR